MYDKLNYLFKCIIIIMLYIISLNICYIVFFCIVKRLFTDTTEDVKKYDATLLV